MSVNGRWTCIASSSHPNSVASGSVATYSACSRSRSTRRWRWSAQSIAEPATSSRSACAARAASRASATRVELADELEPLLARARAALRRAVGGGRVEAPPQQVEHLRARQHVRGEVERLEVAADRRRSRAATRAPPAGATPASAPARPRASRERPTGQQLAPVDPHALVGQVRDDHVVGDVDRRLRVGVALQRLAQRVVQPPQRVRSPVRRRAARAGRARPRRGCARAAPPAGPASAST